jgi:hypothetical protein
LGSSIHENYSNTPATDNADFLAQLLELAVKQREVTRKNRTLKENHFLPIMLLTDFIMNFTRPSRVI